LPLEEWAKIGETSAIIGVVVAAWGVWLSLREASARERDRDMLSWQKATVWEIIAKDGPLPFDEILNAYRIASAPQPRDKRLLRELKRDKLQLILLSLIENRAIHVLPDREISNKGLTYSILRFDPAVGERTLDYMSLVLREIDDHNGELDEPALKDRLERSKIFSAGELSQQVRAILLRLEMGNIISRDQNGKIARRQSYRVRPGASSTPPTDAPQTVAPPKAGGDRSIFNRPPPT